MYSSRNYNTYCCPLKRFANVLRPLFFYSCFNNLFTFPLGVLPRKSLFQRGRRAFFPGTRVIHVPGGHDYAGSQKCYDQTSPPGRQVSKTAAVLRQQVDDDQRNIFRIG